MSRILIAEADPESLSAKAAQARKAGHEVFVAHDGLEALDLSAEVNPEIVLLDGLLPLLSGNEVAELLRTAPQYAGLRGAKVIVMTGEPDPAPEGGRETSRSERRQRSPIIRAERPEGGERVWTLGMRPA